MRILLARLDLMGQIPFSGSLFRIRTSIQGMPTFEFSG